jgi:transcriptional regulator with XRE-family HTH domain
MLGITQSMLAEVLGLTFQQIQKYERGANRIGAGRLYLIARQLDVPVDFFFSDVDPIRQRAIPHGFNSIDKESVKLDILKSPEAQDLIKSFWQISDRQTRLCLLHLVRALAGPQLKRTHNKSTKNNR